MTYTVKWTRQGETVDAFTSDRFDLALDYAQNKIVHGHITERIEITDGTGPLRAVYDHTWSKR